MDIIRRFTEHRVAANMLMLMMIMFGLWGARQINVQLNPSQHYNNVLVEAYWPGATAEDVARQITQPLEHQLRTVKDLRSMNSTMRDGMLRIDMEFDDHVSSDRAVDDVKQAASEVRFLPEDMEPLQIKSFVPYERLSDLLISGSQLDTLIPLAIELERELLALGVDRVEFLSLPQTQMAIQVERQKLLELGISLEWLGTTIASTSRDLPAGSVGVGEEKMQLRSLDQQRTEEGFRDLLVSLDDGRLLRVGDIASVEEVLPDDAVVTLHNGRPTIWMRLLRAPGTDTLEMATALQTWLAEKQADLVGDVEITPLLQTWKFTEQQLGLVLNNGIMGLFLVLIILFVFLNGRVAIWVAAGIPVCFGLAIALFYYGGGSINALSLIGFIMALGIVVDDAIVVAEKSQTQLSLGLPPNTASCHAAQSMLLPVTTSSLTTMAALIPIMLVDGGAMREIPLLMLCIITASLVECFLVLPGHLRSTDINRQSRFMARFRKRMDARGERFQKQFFVPLVRRALHYRGATLCLAVMVFLVALSLLVSGRIKTDMSVGFSEDFIELSAKLTAGAGLNDRERVIKQLHNTLDKTEAELGGQLIAARVLSQGKARFASEEEYGKQYLTLFVELVSADQRTVSAETFSRVWEEHIANSRLSSVEVLEVQMGNELGADLSLYFSGSDIHQLKSAAEELKQRMRNYSGVHSISDDLPYGDDQWVFQLTAEGRAMGFTAESLARQVYAAYEGMRIQIFNRRGQEIEVVVKLPEHERENVFRLREFPVHSETDQVVPLGSVAHIIRQRGISVIQHVNGELAVNVTAQVDLQLNTPLNVLSALESGPIPELTEKYQLQYGLSENSATEQRIIGDMLWGLAGALVLIYLILCWTFASYTWPLAVMLAIPLALTGALFGLYLFQMNLGVLSTLGLFTLSGVIVNDAIVVINDYKSFRYRDVSCHQAIEQAVCGRLRAVLLTSATTTVGLLPMLFESSLMGRFMAPLAVVVCSGMIYGTLLILLVIPAALSVLESVSGSVRRWRADHSEPDAEAIADASLNMFASRTAANNTKE